MIVYCLLSKDGILLSEYGTTPQDYSQEILAMTKKNSTLGTRFIGKANLWCGLLNKKINGDLYCLAVATDLSDNRELVFNCLDKINEGFDKDRREKNLQEAIKVVSKHMRSAMVLPGLAGRG